MEELQSQNVILIILLGAVGMLLLIAGMALFIFIHEKRMLSEKRRMAERELSIQTEMIHLQLDSQEIERKRIGADLHDSLGSLLWGAKVNALVIQRSVTLDNTAAASYGELNYILDECLRTVRRIAWELTPEAFHYAGLSGSVKKLCQQLNSDALSVTFQEERETEWNDDNALQVFRIIQELLSNALKHSKASIVLVTMLWQEHQLQVRVSDNGTGFTLGERNGVGLWNVQQRVKQLHAQISIGNPPSSTGTEIILTIPLSHDKSKD